MKKSPPADAGLDEDEPVGADAEVAVAQPLDRLGREVELLLHVLDDDEVVAQAVHLRELELHDVTPLPRPRRRPPRGSPSLAQPSPRRPPRGVSPVTSTHRTRGSARNHVSCRLAYRRDARLMSSTASSSGAPSSTTGTSSL